MIIHPVFYILSAAICGAIIGLERQLSGHQTAGIRTLAMVSMGACLFTISPSLSGSTETWRMAAAVVTGVGFIGGSVVMKEGLNIIGLTTSTAIWISAGIGICSGGQQLLLPWVGTLLAIIILRFKILGKWTSKIKSDNLESHESHEISKRE